MCLMCTEFLTCEKSSSPSRDAGGSRAACSRRGKQQGDQPPFSPPQSRGRRPVKGGSGQDQRQPGPIARSLLTSVAATLGPGRVSIVLLCPRPRARYQGMVGKGRGPLTQGIASPWSSVGVPNLLGPSKDSGHHCLLLPAWHLAVCPTAPWKSQSDTCHELPQDPSWALLPGLTLLPPSPTHMKTPGPCL